MTDATGSGLAPYSAEVYAASKLNDDAWNWGQNYGAGEIALGINSTTISYLALINKSGYLIETGPMTD